MAATQAGKRLTEAHRLAQARLGAQTVRELFAAWSLLDPLDLDGTSARWLRVVAPIVELRRRNSADLAANYLTNFRAVELGTRSRVIPDRTETVTAEQLATSLTVTGPVSLKDHMRRGFTVTRAAEAAKAMNARAGMRQALNGGRDLTTRTVERDDKALGWARVVSGDPCSFCQIQASRGPVFTSEDSARFEAHDACSCSVEPVYSRDADWPPGARAFRERWEEVTKGLGGDDAINAYRRSLSE